MLDNTTLGSKYISDTGDTVVERQAPVLGRHDDNVEGGLDCGLVPAWEGLPGVRGLELGDGGPALLPRHRVLGAVEAAHLIVQHARELQPQRGRAGRQGRGELHGEDLLLGIEADPRFLVTAAPVPAAHCALLYLEVGGVAHDLGHSLSYLGGDGDLPLEGVLGQVRLQPDDVVAGHHGGGETGELLGHHGDQNTMQPACSAYCQEAWFQR